MRRGDETTRRRMADRLREEPATPSELAVAFDLTPEAVLSHLEHVARTIEGRDDDEQVLVEPPTCRRCGFDDYDDLLNRPSRCPACKCEAISEPTVTVE